MGLRDRPRDLPPEHEHTADWRITGLVRGVTVARSEKVAFIKIRVRNDLRTRGNRWDIFDISVFRNSVSVDTWSVVCSVGRDWLVSACGRLTMGRKYGVPERFFVPRMAAQHIEVLSTRTRELGLSRVRAELAAQKERAPDLEVSGVLSEFDDFEADMFPFEAGDEY